MTLVSATMNLLQGLRRGLESDVARSICNTHPLNPVYGESLSVTLRARADQLWLDLCGVLVGLDAEAALRQAWSISPRSPVWAGLLYSAAIRESSTMRAEANRLLKLCPELLPSGRRFSPRAVHTVDTLGYWLLANEPKGSTPVPDLGIDTRVRPQWRLRFRLASAVERGESLAQLFRRAAAQPSVSDTSRRSEFLRALASLQNRTGQSGRLSTLTIVLFDTRELRLLRAMLPYWSEFVTSTIWRGPDPLANLDALLARRTQLEQTFSQVEQALKQRAFGTVNALLSAVPEDALVNTVARHRFIFRDFDETDLWAHPAIDPSWGPWQPLTAASHQRLSAWRQKSLPAAWTMTPSQVHRAILQKNLLPDQRRHGLFAQDLSAIRRAWSDDEKQALIQAGSGAFVDWNDPVWDQLSLAEIARVLIQHPPGPHSRLGVRLRALPDARPWLAVMAQGSAQDLRRLGEYCLRMNQGPAVPKGLWGRFCASAVGTPEWQAVRNEAMRDQALVVQAVALFERGGAPLDAAAMREAIALALHDPAQRVRHIVSKCLRWVELDPDALPALVRFAPRDLVQAIRRNRQTPPMVRTRIALLLAPGGADQTPLRRLRHDDGQIGLF